MPNFIATLATTVLALTLTACTTLLPATMTRLQTLSPLTADPAALTVAIVLPPGIKVQPGTAILSLHATRADTGAVRGLDLTLTETAVAAEVPVPAGATGRLYRIATADVPRMRALQAELAQWQAGGNRATGTLQLGIGGCATGTGPAPDATGSAYLRIDDRGPFLPLFQDAPLDGLLGQHRMASIGACNTAPAGPKF